MTEITERLPFELANIIYSYVGTHPVAQLIEDKMNEEMISEFCTECDLYLAGEAKYADFGRDWNCYDGMCEYCYGEEHGIDVYTCVECGTKTFKYGEHENTEEGMFCEECYKSKMENEEEDE
jgi:hypothetical protein